MSLLRKVTLAIFNEGSGSLDTLQPLFPEYTRSQLNSAVQNASKKKLIMLSVRGKSRGQNKGRFPSIYVRYKKPELTTKKLPPNSVWQWCNGAATCAVD